MVDHGHSKLGLGKVDDNALLLVAQKDVTPGKMVKQITVEHMLFHGRIAALLGPDAQTQKPVCGFPAEHIHQAKQL